MKNTENYLKKSLLKDLKSQSKKLIRLHLNESSSDFPLFLKKKVFERLMTIRWNQYPDELYRPLAQALADYCRVKRENIVFGNGSNDLIQNLIKTFGGDGNIVLFRPSFSIYSREARIQKKNFIEIPIQPGRGYEAGSWLEELSSACLVFLDSPNNPLGCSVSPELLKKILQRTEGLVVLDEAYAEFSDRSYCHWITGHRNLVILRTFSKSFRLAGARIGYLIAQEEITSRLKNAQLPFPVGIFQLVVALTALEHKSMILTSLKNIKKERQRLHHQLEKLNNFKPFPSDANFLLVKSNSLPASEIFSRLQEKGILVRIFELPELQNFFRVTVGSRKENDSFLKEISHLDKEINND